VAVPIHRPRQERRQRLSALVEAEEMLGATSPSTTHLFRPIMKNNRKLRKQKQQKIKKKQKKNKKTTKNQKNKNKHILKK